MGNTLDVLRTEQKYDIGFREMYRIKPKLSAVVKEDIHNGREGYIVRSLYFDTVHDDDYYDKLDGLEIRRKIRLRIYTPQDKTAKLELKEKTGNRQRKRSLLLEREEAERIAAGDYEPLTLLNDDFALEIYGRMKQYCYVPKCIIEYNRLAYAVSTNDTRITFDHRLRASLANTDLFSPDLKLSPAGEQNRVTMEVKFNNFLLSYVKDAVSVADRTQISLSKYAAVRNFYTGNGI